MDGPWFGGAWAALIGFVMGAWAIWELRKAIASRDWPTATGRVTIARLVEDSDGWETEIRFEFEAGGRVWAGREVIRPPFSTRNNAEAVLADHPPGRPLDVTYDPDEPSIHTLNPGRSFGPFFWLILSVVLLMSGLAVMARNPRPF